MSEADRKVLMDYGQLYGSMQAVSLEDVRRALDAGAPVEPLTDIAGRTPLVAAIERNSVEQVLLVFGRAGPRQPRRLVTEFLATWPTYEY